MYVLTFEFFFRKWECKWKYLYHSYMSEKKLRCYEYWISSPPYHCAIPRITSYFCSISMKNEWRMNEEWILCNNLLKNNTIVGRACWFSFAQFKNTRKNKDHKVAYRIYTFKRHWSWEMAWFARWQQECNLPRVTLHQMLQKKRKKATRTRLGSFTTPTDIPWTLLRGNIVFFDRSNTFLHVKNFENAKGVYTTTYPSTIWLETCLFEEKIVMSVNEGEIEIGGERRS